MNRLSTTINAVINVLFLAGAFGAMAVALGGTVA
tara:strand:- start:18601 stop:18702 length:102 start_codon:yes stop_codon:yes gene_type:complete